MYEIRDIKTDEILVDNLTFDEMAVLYAEYESFYGSDIYACYNATPVPKKQDYVSSKLAYRKNWLHYYEELQAMGNI